MLIVYFSSVTNNTHRFVGHLGLPAVRIPLKTSDPPLVVDEPYCLICPTYGGGVSIAGRKPKPVPIQVVRFLNNEHNRGLIRCVIASGNTNFGKDFATAGDVIAQKCHVPFVYRFELMGTPEDAQAVRRGLVDNAEALGLVARPQTSAASDAR